MVKTSEKLWLLARLALVDPQEFLDRIHMIVTSRLEHYLAKKGKYNVHTLDQILSEITAVLNRELD